MTGTWALIGFVLRRDRLALPLWIGAIALYALGQAASLDAAYPTPADRATLAHTIEGNITYAALYGPARALDSAGGLLGWRITTITATFAALMSIMLVTRHTRAEEERGRTELLGATAIGRAIGGSVVTLGAAGLGLGTAHAIGSGDAAQLPRLVAAALVQLPAVWVLAAVAAALFGLAPRAAPAAWAALGACLLLWVVGPIVDAPTWLMDLSPYTYVPALPAADFKAGPLLGLLAVAAAITAAGVAGFRRRDVGV